MSLFLALLWQALLYSGAIFVGFEIAKVLRLWFTRDNEERRCKRAQYFSTEEQASMLRSAMWAGFLVGLASVLSLSTGAVLAVAGAGAICVVVAGFASAVINDLTKPKPVEPTKS